ncbi:putative thiazole-containing bacteriocin maturation protein [Cytobacillus kochii]
MTKLKATSRLKVKNDTFYLPDPKGGVYFRNNASSFWMDGGTIYQWIEKLIPMFNGNHTLEELTAGLTTPYRNRVYEIGEALLTKGYVRDTSQDQSHQLPASVLEKYASQIEFIESFVDSGAYRFQTYRQAKVLVMGSGSLFVSLTSALLESGLPTFHMMMTEAVPTDHEVINEIVNHAKKDDPTVKVKEIPYGKNWREVVQSFDWILYVSQNGDIDEVKEINQVCKEEKKAFLPALYLKQVGMAGPVVDSETEGCWESAWRRMHEAILEQERKQQPYSSTAGALLANIIVFEFFKQVTGAIDKKENNQFYLLNLESLQGEWISYYSHPLVENLTFKPELVDDLNTRLLRENTEQPNANNLLEYFSLLTAKETGILHIWEEKDLTQLPLSQCYVQAVNPLAKGPATLLKKALCSGLTHEEARREAGLTGLEMYVSQMVKGRISGFMGIGAGECLAEAVCRGLQAYLEEERRGLPVDQQQSLLPVNLEEIEDRSCRYYLQSLTTLNGPPTIRMGNEILGFPVICIESNGFKYISSGLNITLALSHALQKALLNVQNEATIREGEEMNSHDGIRGKEAKLNIPSCEHMTKTELLQSAIYKLKEGHKEIVVYDLSFEPFLRKELAGVYGVQICKEVR